MAKSDTRPDPDALLARIEADAERAARGKLKVFFGACPGVGKTYAMLTAARALKEQGVDVLVGVAETHGRSETAQLLEGLERLPPKVVSHQGRELAEFDLDAALSRKPALILVDELAHSNVAGSRHPKRWQDVEELLAAGIDVYTTVNVQHLESLNDIVGGITGIQVRETLPDRLFEHADEVALVDLPPDDLLQRMKEGKVYLAHQAERAIRNFFRKGNLIALRELALRRTADRVDVQMREYRADQSIREVWQAKERLLVCVGPGAGGDRLVRAAARLATSLHADWIAAYVETPRLQRLSDSNRDKILKTLALARELGAETATLSGQEDAPTLLAYARARNVSKLVVGKSLRTGLSRIRYAPLSDRLSAIAEDVDVYVVAHEGEAPPAGKVVTMPLDPDQEPPGGFKREGYAWALGMCVATTLLAKLVMPWFDLANLIMFYLVGVVWIAASYGRGPSILGSVLSVLAFDFFFVPPSLSLTVADTRYLLTFAIMLAVALTISSLAANLRYQARIAAYRERRTRALNELGRELAGALLVEQIVETAHRHLEGLFQAKVCILLPDAQEKLHSPTPLPGHKDLPLDSAIAQWVYDHQQPAGLGTQSLAGAPMHYLPLKAPMRTRGVLALQPTQKRLLFLPEQTRLLETLASQIALALERVHYVEVAQDALVRMESERLRNGLLSALSHDLRTPLTVLAGLADSLPLAGPPLPQAQAEIAQTIRNEALRTSSLVGNLLDMARLQEGSIRLKREWQSLEEVVGAALQSLAGPLAKHAVRVDLPADLPLLEFDALLMERVFCNLLENAAKYTPAGSQIEIAAHHEGDRAVITFSDNGPGLPPGREDTLFEKFTRGEEESAVTGVGLGLAIVRAIVEAHKGTVKAENRPEGGARFIITLPAGQAPGVPDERLFVPLTPTLSRRRRERGASSAASRRKRGRGLMPEPRAPAPSVVIVEDEPQIRRFVRTTLESEGCAVAEADTAARGLVEAGTRKPDLIILDLGLPDRDGVDVVRDLRGWSSVPILILSARTDESDKVAALDAGADDYLTKPFGVAELLARVRALLRRRRMAGDDGPLVCFGDVTVDLARRQVTRGGVELHLTPIEYRLLTLLIANAGRVLTHRQLLKEVWGPSHAEDTHYLRVYMTGLRRKLEHDPTLPRHLRTETGIGYRLVLEP